MAATNWAGNHVYRARVVHTRSRSTSPESPSPKRSGVRSSRWSERSPHSRPARTWGKLFLARAGEIGALYERLGDFRALLHRYDPRGAFRNDWLRARVLGDGA